MGSATTWGRRPRRLVPALAGLALGASALTASPSPAGAAPTDSDTLVFMAYSTGGTSAFVRNGATTTATLPAGPVWLEGDFSAAPGTDLLVYAEGSGTDGILHVEPTGTGVTPSFRPEVVNGSYTPRAGDFDGNGIDDILWYGYGRLPDSMWLFAPDGSHRAVALRIEGGYVPVVLDSDGDGHDDVVWYGYERNPDSMWVFGPDGTYTTRAVRIDGGGYEPFVGHFGGVPAGGAQEELFWYSGNGGPDSIWTFTATGKVSRPVPDENLAEPIVGDFGSTANDAIYWYRPGTMRETATGFLDGGAPVPIDAPQVGGFWDPQVGDLDGDGDDDIAWAREGAAIVWHVGATLARVEQSYVSTPYASTLPHVTRPTTNEV